MRINTAQSLAALTVAAFFTLTLAACGGWDRDEFGNKGNNANGNEAGTDATSADGGLPDASLATPDQTVTADTVVTPDQPAVTPDGPLPDTTVVTPDQAVTPDAPSPDAPPADSGSADICPACPSSTYTVKVCGWVTLTSPPINTAGYDYYGQFNGPGQKSTVYDWDIKLALGTTNYFCVESKSLPCLGKKLKYDFSRGRTDQNTYWLGSKNAVVIDKNWVNGKLHPNCSYQHLKFGLGGGFPLYPTADGSPQYTTCPTLVYPDQGTSTPDAGVPTPDAALPDAASPDLAVSTPDAAQPDSALPDSAQPDAAVPDTSTPDSAPPDSATPDAAAPDSSVSPDSAITPDSAVSPDAATSSPDYSVTPDYSTSPDMAYTATCGNNACETAGGETNTTCPKDCPKGPYYDFKVCGVSKVVGTPTGATSNTWWGQTAGPDLVKGAAYDWDVLVYHSSGKSFCFTSRALPDMGKQLPYFYPASGYKLKYDVALGRPTTGTAFSLGANGLVTITTVTVNGKLHPACVYQHYQGGNGGGFPVYVKKDGSPVYTTCP